LSGPGHPLLDVDAGGGPVGGGPGAVRDGPVEVVRPGGARGGRGERVVGSGALSTIRAGGGRDRGGGAESGDVRVGDHVHGPRTRSVARDLSLRGPRAALGGRPLAPVL